MFDPMNYPVEVNSQVRMKNVEIAARRWAGQYVVPVGEVGTVVEDGKKFLKVRWPQVPEPVFTRRVDLVLVEGE